MTRRRAPTPNTADALAAIDATVDGTCACGCGTALPADGPSGWFVDAHRQLGYEQRQAFNPHEVQRRPDAAEVYVNADHLAVPLTDPGEPPRDSDYIDAVRYALSAARVIAEVEDAIRSTAGPALTWDRTDADQGEALTNDPRPPFEVSGELRPPATRALLTQRRYCRHCRSAGGF